MDMLANSLEIKMADVVLNNITSGYNIAKINDNFSKIADKLNNDTLNLSSGNNTLEQDVDMNSNDLLNVNDITLGGSSLKDTITNLYLSQVGGTVSYTTKALMDADLSKADGTIALVTNDPTTANNDYYRKNGAIGTGSWGITISPTSVLKSDLASAIGSTLVGYGAGTVKSALDARAILAKPPSSTSNYINQFTDSAGTGNGQLIGMNIEQSLNQSGTVSAYQFGQTTELYTFSSNSATWNGQLVSVYGSCNHFGSGSSNYLAGGAFEAFNDGPGAATQVVGISANAYNGGVAAGSPAIQYPTNNGSALNLRALVAHTINLSSGPVTNAVGVYVLGATNSGGGSIANNYGLLINDQLAGIANYAIYTGAGANHLGDVLQVTGATSLPSETNANAFTVSGGGSGVNGTIYLGDGTGRSLNFASRTGGATTILGRFYDSGVLRLTASLQINSPTKTLGYFTGAGASVAQLTSKATAVTSNTSAGVITTTADALAAGAVATFLFSNTNLVAASILATSIADGTSTAGAYSVSVDSMKAGSCKISIRNQSASTLSEAVKINFAVISGTSS